MASNNVSATLLATDLENILSDITNMDNKLNFLISATTKDKRSKQLMGAGSLGYVQYGLATAKNNVEILARSFLVEEYAKDVELQAQLQQIYNHLLPFIQKLKDTLALLGQDLMDQANEVYNAVKREAKSNGKLKVVAEELGKRYEVSNTDEPAEAKTKPSLN